jgi:hypothetical protein
VLFVLRSLWSPDAAKCPLILRKPLPINRGPHRPNPPKRIRRWISAEAAAAVAAQAEVIDIPLAPPNPASARGWDIFTRFPSCPAKAGIQGQHRERLPESPFSGL